MNTLGRHILVEFLGCSSEILNDVPLIEVSMIHAAKEAGATVISSNFHHFSPFGVSGVVVIQESHLAIHTWPEYRYAAVDLFTCGNSVEPWISLDLLKKAFKAEHGSAIEINRGQLQLLERSEFDLRRSPRPDYAEFAGSETHEKRLVYRSK
jgi:spermidine synthase